MGFKKCFDINAQLLTRNIRKPGDVGNLNYCTFTKNCNGLIGWSFEIPASAYCHPLATSVKKDNPTASYDNDKIEIRKDLAF